MSITTEPFSVISDYRLFHIVITEETGIEKRYYDNSFLDGPLPEYADGWLYFDRAEMDILYELILASEP